MLDQQFLNLFREWLFDLSQEPPQIRVGLPWIGQQMNVFGHIDERHEVNLLSVTGRINMPCQPAPPIVIGQQWATLKARECEFMQLTGFMEMLNRLSMPHRRSCLFDLQVSPAS